MSDTDTPPRKRLVIHAGLGKSGSSAIQKYCRDQPAALRAAGALYLGMYLERAAPSPDDFASSAALEKALEAGGDGVIDRLVALLTAKLASRPGVATFVWSQIGLATHAGVVGQVIARLAPVCDVEVILYFRHQADWLVSAYRQWGVKHKTYEGPIRSFADYLPLAAAKGSDYRAVITAWHAAVGHERVMLRSYDRASDVVADFLGVARLGGLAPDAGSTRHYETPDATWLTLFRLYQGQQDGEALPGALQRALSDNKLDGTRYREVDPAATLPSGAAWQAFAASFDEENAALERDFGLPLGPAGKGPAPDATIPAPAIVIPALLDLILAQERRIAALERRLAQKKQ